MSIKKLVYTLYRTTNNIVIYLFLLARMDLLYETDIISIKHEYNKKNFMPEHVNYEKIDNLVMRLKFFSKLPKPVRISLLKSATYNHFPSGSTVFKQGDFGDLMYIILRGSVNVRI